MVLHVDGGDSVVGEYQSAVVGDHLGQQIGGVAATVDEAAGTLQIEYADDGVDISGCAPRLSAVERIHIGQHAAQPRVVNILCDERVGSHQCLWRHLGEYRRCRPQIEEIDSTGHAIERIDISRELVATARKRLHQ